MCDVHENLARASDSKIEIREDFVLWMELLLHQFEETANVLKKTLVEITRLNEEQKTKWRETT